MCWSKGGSEYAKFVWGRNLLVFTTAEHANIAFMKWITIVNGWAPVWAITISKFLFRFFHIFSLWAFCYL